MKFFYFLIILVIFQNCSFDDKTGIWKNENNVSNGQNNTLKDFKTLSLSKKLFDTEIPLKKKFEFQLSKLTNNKEWNDVFYNKENNFKNFQYNDINKIIFRSKKITKSSDDFILFNSGNVITSDKRGNIIIFSVNQKKIISKFNFYKKKYKNVDKTLNLTIENDVIYVTDNIGYLYAYDFKNEKILWAKNYLIPFRSNIKIFKNKIIAANQNNTLYFFNKENGDILRFIPTEETSLKNKFINNISVDENFTLFLNTYGSLYAINNETLRINWFLNLNRSLNLNPNNLFLSNQVINDNKKVVISSNENIYILDTNNGSVISKKNFSTYIKPVIFNDYLFLITKKNYLISLDLNKGDIIYAYDLNQKISEFLDIKKKNAYFKNIMLVNNKLFIFLKNSYVLKINFDGTIDKVEKLPTKINSHPIFIDGSIIYIDQKNKLSIVD